MLNVLTFKKNYFIIIIIGFMIKKPPSSRGLGHLPFTEETGIRIPLGVLLPLSIVLSTLYFFYMIY